MNNITVTDVRHCPGDSAFLIDDGVTSILYDTGFAFTGEKIAKNVKAVLGDRTLNYIFLTHSHYDHALGAPYIKREFPHCRIVAGEYAARIFQKPSAKSVMRELDQKFAATCGITEYEDLIDDICVDISVNDGDIVTAGDMSFKVISLPGHTRCSVAYYLEKEKLLLSCETLGVFDGESTVVPSYLIGYGTTIKSIKKAQELDIEAMLVPHMGLIGRDKARFYLKAAKISAVETCEEIIAILKGGGSHDDAVEFFKNKFYHGAIADAYPIDAMLLNTNIMVSLIEREFLSPN